MNRIIVEPCEGRYVGDGFDGARFEAGLGSGVPSGLHDLELVAMTEYNSLVVS